MTNEAQRSEESTLTELLYCAFCGDKSAILAVAILKENRRQVRESLMPAELELFDNES